MIRQWRIRAAEWPARRQANPPSPTMIEQTLVFARSFFISLNCKITSWHFVPARYRLFLYFLRIRPLSGRRVFFFCCGDQPPYRYRRRAPRAN